MDPCIVNFRVTEEQYEGLRLVCYQRNIKRAHLLRDLVEEFLQKEEAKKKRRVIVK